MNPTRRCIDAALPRRVRRRSLAVLLVAGVLATGCSAGLRDAARRSDVSTGASGDPEVSLLFSVIAPSMTVAVEGDGHRVSVPLSSSVAWFTDRPERNAGTFDMAAFLSIWDAEGFATDPPNAALAVTVDGEQRQHVVELSDPKADESDATFHAVDIGGDEGTDPVAGKSATHDVTVGTFGPSELFIDNATTPPCPSSITSRLMTQCLVPAKAYITIEMKAYNYCIDATRTAERQEDASFFNSGSSLVVELTDDSVFPLGYDSGESVQVSGAPDPLLVGFGPCGSDDPKHGSKDTKDEG